MNIQIKMRVLPFKPKEGTRSVFIKPRDLPQEERLKPYITAKGNIDYLCSLCGHLLVKSVNAGQVRNLVYECSNCGVYNQVE